MKKRYLLGLVLFASLGSVTGILGADVKADTPAQVVSQANQSNTCTDLLEVTTGQAQIRKVIRFSLFGPGNIHVDFAVPPTGTIDFYEVTFIPENNASYQIQVNFRYPDGLQSTVFSTTATPVANQTYSRRFVSPTGERPFLINTSVAGENNIAYTISVRGCRN
ncbi:MAG TPA: hypothetical protein IGR64_07600 [Leptolyngbyaceae cyanobacterium M65_K2018_010]|nr:hypothetical protein [Leptolyngbyaceae cyanobacterium M65_K2018_010]